MHFHNQPKWLRKKGMWWRNIYKTNVNLCEPSTNQYMSESQLSANAEEPHFAVMNISTRTQRIRKTRVINLKGCKCGKEVSQAEIEVGDLVVRCKVHGCETVWVSCSFCFYYDNWQRYLVPLKLHGIGPNHVQKLGMPQLPRKWLDQVSSKLVSIDVCYVLVVASYV